VPESGDRLLKMGEVVGESGLSRQVIHNYTVLGLIRAAGRTAGGHRLYPRSVFERLRIIRGLTERGYTLRDIAETYLRNK